MNFFACLAVTDTVTPHAMQQPVLAGKQSVPLAVAGFSRLNCRLNYDADADTDLKQQTAGKMLKIVFHSTSEEY